jgi:hypothetical protein
VEEPSHSWIRAFSIVDPGDSISSDQLSYVKKESYSVVLMLSNGVTASRDSVKPAPNPAMTVLGPEIFPFSSCSIDLYWSNATNRIPAFRELPIMSVVHPAYHAFPNGGQGSFAESANLRFNCVRVFATGACC